MNILVKSYTEDGYKPIPRVRLEDEEYGRGLQCFVPNCTDIVPIDSVRKTFYLARRTSKPMIGWWWIGGKMWPDQTKEEAAAANFKRETGLELPEDRFTLVANLDYCWKDRSQAPEEIGCHMSGYTFTVELTVEEREAAFGKLAKDEYQEGTGFSPFDRERLIEEEVFSSVIDLYDHIFPQVKEKTMSLASLEWRDHLGKC